MKNVPIRWYCPPIISPEPQEEYVRREREASARATMLALIAIVSFTLGAALMLLLTVISAP